VGGRNEPGICQGGTPNPVLAIPEFSGAFMGAPYTLQQHLMRPFYETAGERKLIQFLNGNIHSRDVILNFFPVISGLRQYIFLFQKGFLHRGLRPFYPGRQGCLLGYVHTDVKIDVHEF